MKVIFVYLFFLCLYLVPIDNVFADGPATSPEFAIDFGHCVFKRSTVVRLQNKRGRDINWVGDQVLWCPDDHSKIATCNGTDDASPDVGPTTFSGCSSDGRCDIANCDVDGDCDASEPYDRRRSREGPQNVYFEFVKKSSGTQGCWSYDRGGQHRPMRVEILCCK